MSVDFVDHWWLLVGCAVGTVRSRLHRARALLARKLEKMPGKQTMGGKAIERKGEKCRA